MSVNADFHYGELLEDKYVVKRYDTYIKMIEKFLSDKSNVSVLDVGGYYTFLLHFQSSYPEFRDKIKHYEILDYDVSSIEVVERLGAITTVANFDHANLEDISKLSQYDIVICTEVLEHLVDPVRHINSINKLVADNGLCVISLPNENSIFHRIMSVLGMGVDQCAFELYKHLHLPTIGQSKTFVAKYLAVKEITYYINPSLKGSRWSLLGRVVTLLPDSFWWVLAKLMPALFARGVVFDCAKRLVHNP